MMKKILQLFFIACLVYTLDRVYYHLTGDFRLANITYPLPYLKEWDVPPLTDTEKENLEGILNQQFSFLGKGNQSYAFESEDKKYVLKFFKFGHLKPSWFQTSTSEAQKKRLKKVFEGYQLASQKDRENCGLLFVHLNPTDFLNKKITVKDWLGFKHEINLDQVVFAIQKKLTPAKTILSEAFNQGNLEKAKLHIRQLFTLYLSEYAKGIYDRDHNVIYNIGYTDSQAMHIDLGKLRYNELMKKSPFYLKDLRKIALERIDKWVHKYYPQFEKEIREFLDAELSKIDSEGIHV